MRINFAHVASVRFEHSVYRGSLMTTYDHFYIYIYMYIYICIYIYICTHIYNLDVSREFVNHYMTSSRFCNFMSSSKLT